MYQHLVKINGSGHGMNLRWKNIRNERCFNGLLYIFLVKLIPLLLDVHVFRSQQKKINWLVYKNFASPILTIDILQTINSQCGIKSDSKPFLGSHVLTLRNSYLNRSFLPLFFGIFYYIWPTSEIMAKTPRKMANYKTKPESEPQVIIRVNVNSHTLRNVRLEGSKGGNNSLVSTRIQRS